MMIMMTKNPGPMIKHIDELIEMKINFCFQVTVTPYGKDIEPGVPDAMEVVNSFKDISETIGKERMIWRYDPVILNDDIGLEYHKENFSHLFDQLKDHTDRCTFSFIDIHRKLEPLAERGVLKEIETKDRTAIMRMMASASKGSGMIVSRCSYEKNTQVQGITNRPCIDREYMNSLGAPTEETSAPLRPGCRCVRNVDIGDYDTCMHDCIYCYANKAEGTRRSVKRYDAKGEMLFGKISEDDRIVETRSRSVRRITDF